MSEALYESEILKSLEALDDILSKAHIEKLQPGSKRPMGPDWPEEEPHAEDEKDTTKNGTDYIIVKSGDGTEYKLSKAGVKALLAEAQQSNGDDEEEEEEEEVQYKSLRSGVEVSAFLNALTKSVAIYCAELEDHIVKSLSQIHEENGAMSKAIADNLLALEDVVTKSQGNIAEYAEEPARAPKSMLDMSKAISGSDDPELSKSVVMDALMKGVEAGTVSPLEVLKAEQFGVQAINQDVVKSLLA